MTWIPCQGLFFHTCGATLTVKSLHCIFNMVEGSRATIVSVIFPVLATVCVAARLVTRCKILKNPGWEDGIIVVSLVSQSEIRFCNRLTHIRSLQYFVPCLYVFVSHLSGILSYITLTQFTEVKYGLGEHIETLSTIQIITILKVSNLLASSLNGV
jgi:hypothetical protein